MSVIAVCTSRQEYISCVRFSEFKYSFRFDGKIPQGPPESLGSFDIKTVDYELEATWTIERYFRDKGDGVFECVWKKIKLSRCASRIFGNFYVIGSGDNFSKDKFDMDSLPYEKLLHLSPCKKGGYLTITIQVYREDERVFSIRAYAWLYLGADVTLVKLSVGSSKFPIPKAILTYHSDVFAKIFDGNISHVSITDVEESIFELMLYFIITGQFDCNYNKLVELIKAADKYKVKSLVSLCGYRLWCSLCVENAVEILIVADLVKEIILKKVCLDFIIKNIDNVRETDSFNNILVESRPDLLAELSL